MSEQIEIGKHMTAERHRDKDWLLHDREGILLGKIEWDGWFETYIFTPELGLQFPECDRGDLLAFLDAKTQEQKGEVVG